MNENASKAQRKFEEVSKLVDEFGSQSEQLQASKKQLQKAVKTFEEKLEEIIQSAYAEMRVQKQGFEEAQKWYEKTTEEIGDVCYNFEESFGALKNAFDEENFKILCTKIAELTKILEECKALRDELFDTKSDIIEELGKKIEVEMAAVRAQQAEDRAFMEAKFVELLEKISPSTPTEITEEK